MPPLPFTFGIALIARRRARNWQLVEALLELTLASVRAQSDPDFEVVIAGHDPPAGLADDPRFRFLEVPWPAGRPDEHNSDGGMKKSYIAGDLLRRGGGLLMPLDADDWVDIRLVEAARASIGPDRVGGLIETGWAVDCATLRVLPLPHASAFDIAFHRICGSSVIARLDPAAVEPARRDPCAVLGSHHRWPEAAGAAGVSLARLPVAGSYLIDTSENHSERHGAHAGWRRELAARVKAHGVGLDAALAGRFGLELPAIRRLAKLRSDLRPLA